MLKKQKALIAGIGSVLFIGAVFFFLGGEGLLFPYQQITRKQEQLENRRREVDSLQKAIQMLTHDTAHIELVARGKLGMAKQDEKVYKFVLKGK